MSTKTKVSLPLLAKRFVAQLAQCRRLNMTINEVKSQQVVIALPYQQTLIGYPETGVIHGGVITTLMDTASGCAVVCAIYNHEQSLEISPTLDLRVDYMRPAQPNKPVYGFAECYKLSANVAFTRAIAYQDNIDKPIAHAVGAFMRLDAEMVGEDFRRALLGKKANIVNHDVSSSLSAHTVTSIDKPEALDFQSLVKMAEQNNDFTCLIDRVPYATFIGMTVERFGDELICRLPAKDGNLGNPILPAIHGGVIAGFMEMSAIVQLMVFMQTIEVPKVVDFSIDYLRAGYHKATFAECRITRQGRRVANVNIDCWQSSRKQLIATARAHFLID